MIAGLLNQAKRIFEMFDEVLQGKPPEVLVVRTHETIAALLQSVEGQRVAKGSDNSYEASEKFIKQII